MLTCEQEHLSRSLPAILGGLADEAEGVREAALAAGRTLVELYAETALPLLLPAVEDGIVNANWRIRQSSAELLGDLLFKVLQMKFDMCNKQIKFQLLITCPGPLLVGRAQKVYSSDSNASYCEDICSIPT